MKRKKSLSLIFGIALVVLASFMFLPVSEEKSLFEIVTSNSQNPIMESSSWDPSLSTGLVSYYELEDNLATVNVIDIHGPNNGTASTNTNNLHTANGKINSAFNFDGTSEYVDLFQFYEDTGSISFWFKSSTAANGDRLLSSFNSGTVSNGAINIQIIASDYVQFSIYNGGVKAVDGSTDIVDGNWHHLMMTWTSGGNLEGFVDNVSVGTIAIGSLTSSGSTNMQISEYPRTPSTYYTPGDFDELGLWNKTLNSTERDNLYNNGDGIGYLQNATVDNPPTVTLHSPSNASSDANPISFNCSASDDQLLTNVSLYIDGVLNQTNTSGYNANYIFSEELGIGTHNWTCEAFDNSSQSTKPTEFILNVTATTYEVLNESWFFTNSQGLNIYCNIYLNSTSLYNPFFIATDTWSAGGTRVQPSIKAKEYRDKGFFAAACELRGKGESDGSPDASGYEQMDIYEAVETLKDLYPTYINESRLYYYGESGAGGKGYMMGVNYPDYFNAIIPISGMSNYSLWGDLNPFYSAEIDTRISSTGDLNSEGYLSRDTTWGIQNIYSFFAPWHSQGDASVNVTLSRNFNTSMYSEGKSSLVNYTEDSGSVHGSSNDSDAHTNYTIYTQLTPVTLPDNETLTVNGYVHTKTFRVEYLDTINKVGEVIYDFSNENNKELNLTASSYTGNVTISYFNISADNFTIYRNLEQIIRVVDGTVQTNSYGAEYTSGDNITFYTNTLDNTGDVFNLVTTPTGAGWTNNFYGSIVSYYKLDNSSGVVYDMTRNADGSNDGATRGVSGKINQAFSYDGTNDNSNITGVFTNETWTATLWFNAGLFSGGAEQLLDSETGRINLARDTNRWTVYDGTFLELNISQNVTGWHHMAITSNTTHLFAYYDGQILNTTSSSNSSFGGEVVLGARYSKNTNYYNGTLDEVGFWNRTLNSTEIAYMYQNEITYGGVVSPPTVTLNSPVDYFNSSVSNITFNGTVNSNVGVYAVQFYVDGVLNQTNYSGYEGEYTFSTSLIDGTHNWSYVAIDTNFLNTTETRTISIDLVPPTVTLISPQTINYLYSGKNLTLEYYANGGNLGTCWYSYNSINTTINCSENSSFLYVLGENNLIMYVNDTVGNLASDSTTITYKILENSKTYTPSTIEGSTDTFQLNFTVGIGTVSLVNLFYDGTNYSTQFLNVGAYALSTYDLTIPSVSAEENKTFYWNVVMSTGETVPTNPSNQTVSPLSIDNCSTYTTLLFNYTQRDEETQIKLTNNSVEVSLNIYDLSRENLIINFSSDYVNVNPIQICADLNLTNDSVYSVDSTVKYASNESSNYSLEYYNYLNFSMSNLTIPQNVNLFSLLQEDSTEFQLTFRDSDLALAPNVLVSVDRQYVSENIFKTVERPLTDSNGQVVLHLVRNDIVYNFIMTDIEGNIVATFNNLRVFCEDFTIGQCTLNLNALPESQKVYDHLESVGISYTGPTYSNTTKLLSLSFVSSDLTTKTVSIEVTRDTDFGNRTVCTESLTSSSGTITCNMSEAQETDNFFFVEIAVDGNSQAMETIALNPTGTGYGATGYVIAFLMMLMIITLFMDDRQTLLVSIMIGWVAIISLGLIQGALFGSLAAGVWLLVTIIIFFWKIRKEEAA